MKLTVVPEQIDALSAVTITEGVIFEFVIVIVLPLAVAVV